MQFTGKDWREILYWDDIVFLSHLELTNKSVNIKNKNNDKHLSEDLTADW